MILLLQTAQDIPVRLDKAIHGMSICDRFAIAIVFFCTVIYRNWYNQHLEHRHEKYNQDAIIMFTPSNEAIAPLSNTKKPAYGWFFIGCHVGQASAHHALTPYF
jgi:hypothetical protein